MGAVYEDAFVSGKVVQANYRPFRSVPPHARPPGEGVRIVILPSFMGEFDVRENQDHADESPFRPTDLFREIVDRLQRDIRRTSASLIRKGFEEGSLTPPSGMGTGSGALPQLMAERMVSFAVHDARPLVVYPDNAIEVIRDVCPEADFAVVLLDKDVYLSIFFDGKSDQYPNAPLIYTDITDVKNSQHQEQLDLIGRFIVARLRNRLAKETSAGSPAGTPAAHALRN